MPLYQYQCNRAHVTEQRASLDTESIRCGCGNRALRVQVYRDQYMHAETGPKGGRKNEPPRDEKSYREQFKEYREATQEMDYAYSRVDDPTVKPPNYFKEGLKKAKKINPKVKV